MKKYDKINNTSVTPLSHRYNTKYNTTYIEYCIVLMVAYSVHTSPHFTSTIRGHSPGGLIDFNINSLGFMVMEPIFLLHGNALQYSFWEETLGFIPLLRLSSGDLQHYL